MRSHNKTASKHRLRKRRSWVDVLAARPAMTMLKGLTLTGTPQGGIISPLAANIYLHQLDRYMESTYLHFTSIQRVRRRQRGKGNVLYVRYADDFEIGRA